MTRPGTRETKNCLSVPGLVVFGRAPWCRPSGGARGGGGFLLHGSVQALDCGVGELVLAPPVEEDEPDLGSVVEPSLAPWDRLTILGQVRGEDSSSTIATDAEVESVHFLFPPYRLLITPWSF